MKKYTKYLFAVLAILLIGDGYGRVPANLAGTDIFPEKNQDDDLQEKLNILKTEKFPCLRSVLSNQDYQNDKPYYVLGLLALPLNEERVKILLPYFEKSIHTARILYAAIARDFDIDKLVWLSNLTYLISNIKNDFLMVNAVAAATEGMKSTEYQVRSKALYLFKALVEKGQGFAEAATAATEGMKRDNYLVRSEAYDLFKALFEKGQGFDEAQDCLNQLSGHEKQMLARALEEAQTKAVIESKTIHDDEV